MRSFICRQASANEEIAAKNSDLLKSRENGGWR